MARIFRDRKTNQGFVSIIFIVIVLLVVAAFGYFTFFNSESQVSQSNPLNLPKSVLDSSSPSPTPFPFQELTIPYLRNREYKSSLGMLQKISENQGFTSYLTSYDSDGLRINGLLTIPKGSPPEGGWPAVVFVHGYIPPQEYKTTQNYVSYVEYLANRGLVVFKIDLRGHDSSEGEPSGAYYSGDYIIDTLNAYSALENSNFVNPEKIGLWGHSMAGNVVFRSFVAKQDVPKVVIWAGAVYTYEDFSDYRISDRSYQPPPQESERRRKREELFNSYGEFDPESEFWKQIVPTNYLDGVAGQIQIHHAVDDTIVNIGYSRNLMLILDNTQIGHKLFEYPSGGHNITGGSFTQAMQATADFFRE
jgi:dipeptidyl aminopeptidase/acylaminoacyl peptidase